MLHWIIIGLLVVWIIVMWYVVIYAMMRGWAPYIRSKRQRKDRVHAKIKSKLGLQDFNPLEYRMEITQKALLFDCEDGVEREYVVHDDVWDWVETGDDGTLVYQGHLFVDFEARRPRHDLDKAYKRLMRT